MTVRKVLETQSDTGTWAADNSGIAVDLLKSGQITRIYATVEVTPSAALAANTSSADGPLRLLRSLSVTGGSHTYFAMPDDDGGLGGSLLYSLNRYDGFGVGMGAGASITAPNHTYHPFTWVFHCGVLPKDKYGRDNPFDLSGSIPAVKETMLRASWVTSGNDVMDDTVTISSAVLRFTLAHILGSQDDILNEARAQGVVYPAGSHAMIPAWTSEVYATAATHSDYGLKRDLPTGGFLRRVGVLSQDATATRTLRAPDEVTNVSVQVTRDGTVVQKVNVDYIKSHLPHHPFQIVDGAADFAANAPEGIYIAELPQHMTSPMGRLYGMFLGAPGVSQGNFQLGLSVGSQASGDDILILYERRLPVDMRTLIA